MDLSEARPVVVHPVDDPRNRAAQQERLQRLHDELVVEGADDTTELDRLRGLADNWPE